MLNETLEQQVQDKTAEVRQVASELIKATQKERLRISHLLHDDLQQNIYAIQMQMTFLENILKDGPEAARKEAEEIASQLNEILDMERLADEARKLRAERFKPKGTPPWLPESPGDVIPGAGAGKKIGDIAAGTISGFAARLLPFTPAAKKTEEKILDETEKVKEGVLEVAANTAVLATLPTIFSFK